MPALQRRAKTSGGAGRSPSSLGLHKGLALKPRVRFANPKFEFGSVPAITGPDLVRFRGRGGRIRFGSSIQEPDSVRFFGAREPVLDSVRFLRLETRFGPVWPDRIPGRRLGSGFRLVLGDLFVY